MLVSDWVSTWLAFFDDKLGLLVTIETVAIGRTLPVCMSNDDVASASDCLAAFQQELDYLFRTLRRLGVNESEVEDLVHEVFLIFHRRWPDYDASRALRPWLFGIAFRVASAHRKRTVREIPHASPDALVTQELSACSSAEQALMAEQTRRLVLAALDCVPLARRAVFVMHDIDEVPMRDIASALSIPLFTAYSRLRKARKEFEAAVRSIDQGMRPR
ncbi:MAG TPA: sigma-70 family RNA polymerase sigma factor [Polyangiaceae bacterium]|nr:sigma-70 family RNA polymerase sigma factor [Polyangiaceae bacterium]